MTAGFYSCMTDIQLNNAIYSADLSYKVDCLADGKLGGPEKEKVVYMIKEMIDRLDKTVSELESQGFYDNHLDD